jgi:hypothetical protein
MTRKGFSSFRIYMGRTNALHYNLYRQGHKTVNFIVSLHKIPVSRMKLRKCNKLVDTAVSKMSVFEAQKAWLHK